MTANLPGTTQRVGSPPLIARRRAALAGVVSMGLALGLTELAGGLFADVPSAIVVVGTVVIDYVPGVVERVAISIFGQADKAALTIGIVVIALAVGAVLGTVARRRFGVAVTGFGLFVLIGWLAGPAGGEMNSVFYTSVLVGAAGVGLVVLHRLLDAATDAGGSDLRTRVASVAADRRRQAGDEQEGLPEGSDSGPERTSGGHWAVAGRRRFLRLAAGVGAAAVVSAVAGRLLLQRTVAPQTTVTLPEPVEPVAAPGPAEAFADIDGLTPIVVENDDFYRIDVNLVVPNINAATWRLRVTGMVDREVELTYDDILAMPLVERYVTLSCVSNEVGGGLVGNAAWTGVPLADILNRAGVADGATQIVGRAVDGWTGGFPTEAAFDGRGTMLAVGMNNQPLPRVHGYPARLIVPGLYGYVSATKWLTEIELTTFEAFDAYWVPRGWARRGPIKTQSRIDVPRGSVDAGEVAVAGVAWHPNVGISNVEVSIDDGNWTQAELTDALSDDAWRQWRYRWDATPGEHTIRVRATDGDGNVQPAERTPPFPDGATGYHTVTVVVEA